MDGKVFAQRLKALRKEQKLTQKELGKMVYVTSSHISHLEQQEDIPSRKLIKLLSIALDCSEDYLLGLTDERGVSDLVEREDAGTGSYQLALDTCTRGGDYTEIIVKCSECGHIILTSTYAAGSNITHGLPKRCPHCGK